jgi:hypothetical protein
MATEVRAPEPAPLHDLRLLRGGVHDGFDRRRLARAHQFDHHPLARRTDERYVPDEPFFDEVDDRPIDPGGERFCRTFVAEGAAL